MRLKACVLYILRVGVTDQMTEPTQRSFLVFLGRKVCCKLFYHELFFLHYFKTNRDSFHSLFQICDPQLESADCSPAMRVAALRILSYLLTTLGEVRA